MICDRDAIKSVDSLPIHDRIWKNRVTSADCTILVDFCAKHLNVRSAESVCYKSLVKCDARTCRKSKDANLYSLWNLSTHTYDKLNKYRNCIHFFFRSRRGISIIKNTDRSSRTIRIQTRKRKERIQLVAHRRINEKETGMKYSTFDV